MQLVTSDIVADLCGLSVGVLVVGAAIGLALWLFGWWSHRFWIVLAMTVAAGVYGLQEAATFKSQPLVAATLLAVAAGVLALNVVRLVAFAAGGFSGLVLMQSLAPSFEQPLAAFVGAGLVSLLLFRWFIMGLTSLTGAVLLCYTVLAFLNQRGSVDAVTWTDQGGNMLNWICGLVAAMGFVFQLLAHRRARRRMQMDYSDSGEAGLLFGMSKLYRRAG